MPVTESLTYPIVLTTKKTLIVIKTIMKTKDPRCEIENEVTNSETLNSQTFFSQAFSKVASFTLVLDLMHECYVILFPDIFNFLIWNLKLKLLSTNKAHFYSLLVTFDVLRPYVVTEKKLIFRLVTLYRKNLDGKCD